MTDRRLTVPFPVVLASASPRRSELLKSFFDEFEVVVSGIDEEALTVPDPRQTAERLAEAKADAAFALRGGSLTIGADTVVAFPEGEVWTQLAKPRDAADARRMLQALSGRRHRVITGVALVWPGGRSVFSDTTEIRFRALSAEEIAEYVASGEPLDKAGGYAIQGGAAGFVTEVVGSVSNVIGLPTEALETQLRKLGK